MSPFYKGVIIGLLILVFSFQKISASPNIIINEIAWSGTNASTSDEWIELYNITENPIDLTGWNISTLDSSINATLSGSIQGKGYFLLERTDNNTVSDITADQIYTGALNNNGGTVILKDDHGTLIDSANGDGGIWPGGSNTTHSSMERINPLLPDTDSNWGTNNGIVKNGQDVGGNPINGTPKSQNSIYISLPTSTPTEVLLPTVSPTLTPTVIPTDSPTVTPAMKEPTVTPTRTSTPTLEPTTTPALIVTPSPTLVPTLTVIPTPMLHYFPKPFKFWWNNFWGSLWKSFPHFPL